MRLNLLSLSLAICTLLLSGGCAGTGTTQSQPPITSTQAAKPEISSDVRFVLAGFAKSHQEKIQLGTFAGSFFLPVDEPFKPFFKNMGAQQKELSTALKAWAKANKVSLEYVYANDANGRAMKAMEKKQEALSRSAKKDDFQRDMLMHMYHDYEWQICLIDAIQPQVADADLNAYLKKSRAVHEAGSAEISALLKKYKFVP